MNAIDILNNITSNQNLSNYPFKYCLVNKDKVPYKTDGDTASPSNKNDFCNLDKLLCCKNLNLYVGIGISIQASDISAIDVDHCFSTAFDLSTCDDRGKAIIDMFKDSAYVEFSFSGTGLRILFKADNIENYADTYYIKNDKNHIEYYQPNNSNRYVTLTGRTIYNNKITNDNTIKVKDFLDKYMKRDFRNSIRKSNNEIITDNRPKDELLRLVRKLYLKDFTFQDIWFDRNHYLDEKRASLESDKDFILCKYLYGNVTKDKNRLKEIFEESPYFKTKDSKHLRKWQYNNNRYFEYIWRNL